MNRIYYSIEERIFAALFTSKPHWTSTSVFNATSVNPNSFNNLIPSWNLRFISSLDTPGVEDGAVWVNEAVWANGASEFIGVVDPDIPNDADDLEDSEEGPVGAISPSYSPIPLGPLIPLRLAVPPKPPIPSRPPPPVLLSSPWPPAFPRIDCNDCGFILFIRFWSPSPPPRFCIKLLKSTPPAVAEDPPNFNKFESADKSPPTF